MVRPTRPTPSVSSSTRSEALAAQIAGDTEGALKHAKAATRIEETQDPPSGPTYPMKPLPRALRRTPARRRQGEKARAQFETSLTRTPNRTASLLGLARAATALGDQDAANRAYATLQTFLTEADGDVPYLEEVRSHATATTDMQQ